MVIVAEQPGAGQFPRPGEVVFVESLDRDGDRGNRRVSWSPRVGRVRVEFGSMASAPARTSGGRRRCHLGNSVTSVA